MAWEPVPAPRPGSRLDPRVRLFVGVLIIMAVLLTRSRPALITESLLLASGLIAFGRGKIRRSSLHLIWPTVGTVFVISFLAFGLDMATDLSLRLVNLFAASALFFQTLAPEELAVALRSLKIPYPVIFMLLTALRYVPLLGRALRNIYDAQTARGIDVRWRLTNVPRLTALLMPLLVQAFMLAENLAMAMESRGFSRPARSEPRRHPFTARDALCAALGILALVGLLFWEKRGP
ncbi:energy-coupling factor transporter transmembrane component T family protein [Desulfosoma sp.]